MFGLVHVGIMLIGYYTGWSINRLLKIVSNGFIAGIFGVVIAHVVADYIAATLDPDIRPAALGIVAGGLLPLILIPFLEKYITKRTNNQITQITKSSSVSFHGANWTNIGVVVDVAPEHATIVEVYVPSNLRTIFIFKHITRPNPILISAKDWVYV